MINRNKKLKVYEIYLDQNQIKFVQIDFLTNKRLFITGQFNNCANYKVSDAIALFSGKDFPSGLNQLLQHLQGNVLRSIAVVLIEEMMCLLIYVFTLA